MSRSMCFFTQKTTRESHRWGFDNRKVLLAIISKKNSTNGLSCYILSVLDGLETIGINEGKSTFPVSRDQAERSCQLHSS